MILHRSRLQGGTVNNGAISTEWLDYDWAGGMYAVLRVTGLSRPYSGGTYSDTAGWSNTLPLTLTPAKENKDAFELIPMVQNAKLIVTLQDTLHPEKPLTGRTLQIYENGSDTPLEISITDNGDGSYTAEGLNETTDNGGSFRVVDEASGCELAFSILGLTSGDTVEKILYVGKEGNLPDILKKNGEDFIGDIDLLYQGKIVAPTVKTSTYADKLPRDAAVQLTVDLYGFAVDESLVEDDVVYSYPLPPELTPNTLGSTGTDMHAWTQLTRVSGRVNAWGRILEKDGAQVFQVYFENTAKQYDISFGYTYTAGLNETLLRDGGSADPTWFEKTLHFEVETEEPPKNILITKSARWVRDTEKKYSTDRAHSESCFVNATPREHRLQHGRIYADV